MQFLMWLISDVNGRSNGILDKFSLFSFFFSLKISNRTRIQLEMFAFSVILPSDFHGCYSNESMAKQQKRKGGGFLITPALH